MTRATIEYYENGNVKKVESDGFLPELKIRILLNIKNRGVKHGYC